MKIKSNYGQWTLLYNKYKKEYEVVQILDYNKNLLENSKLEFFTGSFEDARKYFLGEEQLNREDFDRDKIFDRFIRVIEYYQLEEKVVTRLSNELYDKLLSLCSYKKYFVPEKFREDLIFDCLEEAKRLNLLKDDKIKNNLFQKDENNKRLYKQNIFENKYRDELIRRNLING